MIDVIIPVYRGARETRRCLDSVLGSVQREAFEVVAVDDASPDPDIAALVRDLAARGRITLVSNAMNAGFVHSVNRGMSLHPDRDVVLLNSDTEVANDWLDRLRQSAWSSPDIGTATPFSNNATICSYPFPGWPGGAPGTLGLAALDRLFATTNAGRTLDLPTAVGYCMYIRRACLNEVGLFDAERFGRGYGEENDFSLRAARAGWRNVLAGNVYVFHEGAVSFAGERSDRAEGALRALLAVHPEYMRMVRDFNLRDPVQTLRQAVDAARIAAGTEESNHVLGEQAAHRAQLRARLATAEEQIRLIEELRRALSHAEGLLAVHTEEIAKLRAGLAHAEALVAEREARIGKLSADLDRMRGVWLWRYLESLMRRLRR